MLSQYEEKEKILEKAHISKRDTEVYLLYIKVTKI